MQGSEEEDEKGWKRRGEGEMRRVQVKGTEKEKKLIVEKGWK